MIDWVNEAFENWGEAKRAVESGHYMGRIAGTA